MSILNKLSGRPDPEATIRAHGPQIYRHLKKIFGPAADVDDVYQIVCVEVLRSLPSFKGFAKMSTWIRRITWNVAYQEMRQHYRHKRMVPVSDVDATLAPSEVESRTPTIEDTVDRRAAMRKVYEGLAQLPPSQRSAVIMHDIEDKTLREIGHALGRPIATVASQLYAGRAKLCEMLRAGQTASSESAQRSTRGERKP